MTKDRKPLALLAVIAVSLVLVSALVAVNVDARGASASGKKGGGGTTYSGTCAATPNPVALWGYVTISGSGFAPNSTVGYTITWGSGATSMGWTTSNDTGNVSMTGQVTIPGTATVKFGSIATCSFQVN